MITDEELDEWEGFLDKHASKCTYLHNGEVNTLIQALRAERKWSAELERYVLDMADEHFDSSGAKDYMLTANAHRARKALAKKKEIIGHDL